MVIDLSGWSWRFQPPSWVAWWWRLQSGSRLERSVGPPRVTQVMWWGWQCREATVQPGIAHVAYMARRARRWARLARRTSWPRSTQTPLLFNTTGMIAAWHAIRR